MVESKTNRGLMLALTNAFLMSFCSLGYQQTLALTLSDSTDNFVFAQTLSLGVFLLGMGLGSLACGRVRTPNSSDIWARLLQIEWALALCGFLSATYVYMGESVLSYLDLRDPNFIYLAVAPFALWIGFLTGFEVPLLLRLNVGLKAGHILAANYLGAFAAAVLVPVYMLPKLDVVGVAHALGLVNFVVASFILPMVPWRRIATPVHLIVGITLLSFAQNSPWLQRLHLQMIYFSPHITQSASFFSGLNILEQLGEPLRRRSNYQWIDILPPEFSSNVQGQQDFQLYLDRKLQLSSGNYQRYHESMVHGGINLLKRTPKRVLILGGGDGLLAKDLLTYPDIENIDLVELDAEILKLARSQRDLVRLNGDALADSRVTVHLGDAFQFVRGRHEPYDLVLIDFPFPVNYDLSLLFTKEFYALTRKNLAPDGVAVLDFPLPDSSKDHLPSLVKTLRAAGFSALFAFGTEDFFIAAGAESMDFDYEPLFSKVSNATLTNLISRMEDLDLAEASKAGRVNSVLFPIYFGTQRSERQ